MKREYVKPVMMGEAFVANEYVAACYKIACNVPTGFGFVDNNGNKQYDLGETKLTSDGVSGCGNVHVGVQLDKAPTENAMWQPQKRTFLGLKNYGDAYGVFWWSTGNGSNNQHFSKVVDAEWETNPNAS